MPPVRTLSAEMIRADVPYSWRTWASSGSIAGPSSSTRVGTVHHPHGLDPRGSPRDLRVGQDGLPAGAGPQEPPKRRTQLGRAGQHRGETVLLGRLGEPRDLVDHRLGALAVD